MLLTQPLRRMGRRVALLTTAVARHANLPLYGDNFHNNEFKTDTPTDEHLKLVRARALSLSRSRSRALSLSLSLSRSLARALALSPSPSQLSTTELELTRPL